MIITEYFIKKKIFLLFFCFCFDIVIKVIFIKVKLFDEEDEFDLENDINQFINNNNIELIDIKYQVAVSVFSEEQIFCFSALILYTENNSN
ncbi:MAG: sporulation protein Cse60 [Bacilli bacterium]|nr:sporulation protein Cse60 [Bacilli bacterium]